MKKCELCGKDISDRHGNAKYCKNCGYEKHLEKAREKQKKEKERREFFESLSDSEQQQILEILAKKMLQGNL